jgi:hypothetical protein
VVGAGVAAAGLELPIGATSSSIGEPAALAGSEGAGNELTEAVGVAGLATGATVCLAKIGSSLSGIGRRWLAAAT